jgi:uncharacterized surface protein with fasciclin (FAS1) repeats
MIKSMKNSINQLIKGGMMLVLVAFMASCSEIEEQTAPMANSNLKSIPEVLKSLETGDDGQNTNARKSAGNTYATFNAALGKSGLASVFAKNELTVFAPTDAAFAELNLNPGNIGNVEGLTEILLYHVVAGSVFAADLTEGFVPTVNGAAVEITLMGGPKVNDADIILVDKQARNGVIHGINAVLLPPTKNLMELVNTTPGFSILKFALEATGLDATVATTNNLTVFAPTDVAFGELVVELGFADLGALVAAVGLDGLESVLKYHVFAGGRVYSSDLTNTDITMFSGEDVTVDVSGPKLIDVRDRESMIIATDIQATNGVVHVINKVILNF